MYERMRLVSFLAALTTAVCVFPAALALEEDQTKLVDANNQFAFDLYGQVRGQEENLFLSPYSVSEALAMVYAGARGITEREMAKTLHFSQEQQSLASTFAKLNGVVVPDKLQGNRLLCANALWSQKGHPFVPDYIRSITESFRAQAAELDFARAGEEALATINSAVEKQTEGRVKNLLGPRDLNNMTRLVLTNAIYFKGDWAYPFNPKHTKPDKFYLTADKTVMVPMMRRVGNYKWYEDERLRLLEMPYSGDVLTFVAIEPKKLDGLASLETGLSKEKIETMLTKLQEGSGEVQFPRFKLTSQFQLNKVLAAMGMPSAFDEGNRADFSGISSAGDLYLTAVVHKAYLEVNEQGSQAAAATAAVTGARGAWSSFFRANRPFFFLIRHKPTNSILFMGRVMNPIG
jgi:serpin B